MVPLIQHLPFACTLETLKYPRNGIVMINDFLPSCTCPCPWGLIWKRGEWRKFVDWVITTQEEGDLPFVPEQRAYNYNSKLRSGVDVHLSWLWRYNTDFGIKHLRYSFTKCSWNTTPYKWEFRKGVLKPGDIFLAIPYETTGELSANILVRHIDTRLVQFDCNRVLEDFMRAENS